MDRPFPAYQGDEPYLFVCYAHEDGEVVYPEIQWLKDQGFNIWYDEGISPGTQWRAELSDRIKAATLFLFFVSPRSVTSGHCQREVELASDHDRPMLAVHLEPTELPSGMDLALAPVQFIPRHELSEPDYRLKLLQGTSDHVRRGISATSASPPAAGFSGRQLAMACAVALVVGAIGIGSLGGWPPREAADRAPDGARSGTIRTVVHRPSGVVAPTYIAQPLAISSDGTRLVFTGRSGKDLQLYLRHLDDLEAIPIAGTRLEVNSDRAGGNFALSPDGEQVAFVDNRDGLAIKVVPLGGGRPTTVCQLTKGAVVSGLSWGAAGTIAFAATSYPGLMQVHASGSAPEALTQATAGPQMGPHFLPDGRSLLYWVRTDWSRPTGRIMALDTLTGEESALIEGTSPRFAESGHLLSYRDDAIYATPFDPQRLEVTGPSVRLVEGVQGFHNGHFSVSRTGAMAYMTGSALPLPENRPVWVGRDGAEKPLALEPESYGQPRISPDGSRIALTVPRDPSGWGLWVHAPERDTFDPLPIEGTSQSAVWTSDNRDLIFLAWPSWEIGKRPAGRIGTAELLYALGPGEGVYWPRSWSGAHEHLLMDGCTEITTGCRPFELPPGKAPRRLWETSSNDRHPAISPDGRWIAYQSDDAGVWRILVRPYPNVDAEPITVAEGRQPLWRQDGKEIFFIRDTQMMAAAVTQEGSTLVPGAAVELFPIEDYIFGIERVHDVAPDGQRFLMLKPVVRQDIVLMQGVFEEIERRLPRQ